MSRAGYLMGPTHGLVICGGYENHRQVELFPQFGNGFPIARFSCQHQIVNRRKRCPTTRLCAETCALRPRSRGKCSITTPIGASKIASIRDSIPIRKRSESTYLTFVAMSSQKRARTSDERVKSEDFPLPIARVVAIRIHLTSSRSPSRLKACRIDRTGECVSSSAEFRYLNNR